MRFKIAGSLALVALAAYGCGGSGSITPPPPPPTAPSVTSTSPAGSATNVAVSAPVTATFSEAMSSSSITSSTFTLAAPGGAGVTGTVSYSAANLTATFQPTSNLAPGTQYTATITTGATSSSGTALAANYAWTFTTAAAPPTPPTVSVVSPLNGATSVAINTTVTATFSEAMSSASISTSTFTLAAPGGAAVTGSVSYNATGFVATFTLAQGTTLAYNTLYTATITTGAQSSSGAALAQNYTWTFTTAAAPAPPTVTAISPANGSTVVPIDSSVSATFSQAMNSNTITGSTFTLATSGGTAVNGLISYNAATQVATFAPSANLAYDTQYTVTLTTGIQNSNNVALANPVTWSFTTVPAPAPTVANTVPAANATDVALGATVTATFSQQMNSATLTGSTFTLSSSSGPVSGLITYSSATATATFTPSSQLSYSTTYTATITTGAQNTSGTALAANYSWSFTTEANPSAVTVDFGTTYQTIRGFGGSTAWLGTMPQAVATALFSPTGGLGLSILRVRIDPEGSASGGTNGAMHNYPYETGEWDYEAANGLEAVTANPNAIVFASPWTPPAAWKLSGSSSVPDDGETWNQSFNSCAEGSGYCGGYLDSSHYADYANYLEDFVTFFNSVNGFNLYAISMQNEPEENVTYESCVWLPEEMDSWVANNASTITADAYSTKLIMPESDVFNPVDAAATLNDTNAEGLVSIVGGHIYQVLSGGSIVPYSIPAGDSPKELWMTEFGPLSTATPSWSEALTTFAESIHNSMVTGQYNAYVWWGLFGQSVGNCATGAGTCGLVDNAGNLSVVGDVVGQYSKFVLPGYLRASATASPVAGVFLSAYTGSASGTQHYVIVAINANSTAESLDFTLENGAVTSLTPYQSTSAAGLQPQSAVSVTGGQFTYTLPAESITTFVQ